MNKTFKCEPLPTTPAAQSQPKVQFGDTTKVTNIMGEDLRLAGFDGDDE